MTGQPTMEEPKQDNTYVPSSNEMGPEEISTAEFSIGGGKVVMQLVSLYGKGWIGVIVAGIIVFVVFGIIFAWQWFFVALLWICIIVPMLLVYIYFYYGLQPLTCLNGIVHSVSFSDSCATISFLHKKDYKEKERGFWKDNHSLFGTGDKDGETWAGVNDKDEWDLLDLEESHQEKFDEYSEIPKEPDVMVLNKVELPYRAIIKVIPGTDSIIITADSPKGFLLIPYSSLDNTKFHLKDLLSKIESSKKID